MSVNRLPDYLDHMLLAASDACDFVTDLNKAGFLADKRTQQAVIMNLIIMGEAATKVMDRYAEFAEQQPEIPWRNIRGCVTALPMATSTSTSIWSGIPYSPPCRLCHANC